MGFRNVQGEDKLGYFTLPQVISTVLLFLLLDRHEWTKKFTDPKRSGCELLCFVFIKTLLKIWNDKRSVMTAAGSEICLSRDRNKANAVQGALRRKWIDYLKKVADGKWNRNSSSPLGRDLRSAIDGDRFIYSININNI